MSDARIDRLAIEHVLAARQSTPRTDQRRPALVERGVVAVGEDVVCDRWERSVG